MNLMDKVYGNGEYLVRGCEDVYGGGLLSIM